MVGRATSIAAMSLTIADRIRLFRVSKGFKKAKDFAAALGVPQSTVSRWETGVFVPDRDSLVAIANVAKTTIEEVAVELGIDQSRQTSTARSEAIEDAVDVKSGYEPDSIPVIAEGEATPFGLHWTTTIMRHAAIEYIARPHDVTDPDAYGILVIGDSMEPVYRKGQRLIVAPGDPVEDGDDVYVQLSDGSRLIKTAYRINNGWRLESVNQAYAPREVSREEIEAIHPIVWAKRKIPGRRVIDDQTGRRR